MISHESEVNEVHNLLKIIIVLIQLIWTIFIHLIKFRMPLELQLLFKIPTFFLTEACAFTVSLYSKRIIEYFYIYAQQFYQRTELLSAIHQPNFFFLCFVCCLLVDHSYSMMIFWLGGIECIQIDGAVTAASVLKINVHRSNMKMDSVKIVNFLLCCLPINMHWIKSKWVLSLTNIRHFW